MTTGPVTGTSSVRGMTRSAVERVAAHETGHGVVWAVLGLAVDDLQVDTTWTGSAQGGWCALVEPVDLDVVIEAYLIGLMGGAAAEHRYLTRHLGRGDRDAHYEIAEHWGGDVESFDRHARAHHGRTSRDQAFVRARDVVDAHAGVVDALTVRLGRELYLPGAAVHTALSGGPPRRSGDTAVVVADRSAAHRSAADRCPAAPCPGQPPLHRLRDRHPTRTGWGAIALRSLRIPPLIQQHRPAPRLTRSPFESPAGQGLPWKAS